MADKVGMETPMKIRNCLNLLAAFVAVVSASSAHADGKVNYGEEGRKKNVGIADSFKEPMQCILDALQDPSKSLNPGNRPFKPSDVGCFGTRAHNASAHPTGHACDVDQSARDVTKLNGTLSSAAQISLADNCKAVSGCVWRNSDCGHFEQMSAPYSPTGTGLHHYGEEFRDHPLAKRSN
jgi:hypothetical protein